VDFLVQAGVSNAVIVSLLAPIVLAVDRLSQRPALVHRLWLLLLIKLVTPPLLPITLSWSPDSRSSQSAASRAFPADQSGTRSESFAHAPAADTLGTRPPAGFGRDSFRSASDVISLAQSAAWHVTLRWGPSLPRIWLAISVSWLVWTFVRFVQARRGLGSLTHAPADVQDMARLIAGKFNLKRAPPVWFVPGSVSPALWAMGGRCRLLVPRQLWDRIDADQRAVLLAHELAHLRRRDHWIRPLELFAAALYWWLPVVWWLRRSLREVEEQCCDAWVVWLFPESKAAYAKTLLDTIDFLADARPALPLAASGLGTVEALKTRLSRIMKGSSTRNLSRRGRAWVTALTVIGIPLTWRQDLGRGVPRGYHIVDLGAFDPVAINNVGQIIGSPLGLPKPRAHRWDHGRWIDLANDPGIFVTATDINDRGQVTGWYEVFLEPARKTTTPGGTLEFPASYSPSHAFRTAPNRPINVATDDIGTLGGPESRGWAINNAGQVAGESSLSISFLPPYRLNRAFRTGPNQPINPRSDQVDRFDAQQIHHGVLGVAMNNLGDVVLNTDFSTRRPAFHAAPGRIIEPNSPSLAPHEEPGMEVRISAINDAQQVIARVYSWGREPGDVPVAFRLRPGRRINLEADRLPRSFIPKAINDDGLLLGELSPLTMQPYSGQAIYDGRRFHRLSELIPRDSGWMIAHLTDINDRGQVIGTGVTPYHDYHGLLLDPASGPAPFFWLFAGTALTGLGHAAGCIGTNHGRRTRMRSVARKPANL
jgi:beta-lactamase regulating signal transducer with metallopeptidase domain